MPFDPSTAAPESAPSGGGFDPSSAKPVTEELSGSAKSLHDVGQFGRGAVSGFLGMPGALEEFGLGLVPGGDKETRLLPNPSEVDKKLFSPPQNEKDKATRGAGEFVGGFATPGGVYGAGKGAVSLAKKVPGAIKEAGEIGSRLMPGAVKKGEQEITSAQGGVGADVGSVTDISTLGGKMYKDLSGRLNALTKDRQATAKKLKGEYLNQPIEVERDIVGAYRQSLDDALGKVRDLSPDQVKFINESKSRIAGDPSMEAIEIERRRLGDIASGAQEGYGAIEQQFAGELKKKLTTILRDKVPASGKFIDAYRAQSEPIDLFNATVLGKKATKGASEYLPDVPKFDPADLPKAAFKTKFTVDLLKQLTNNDTKMINGAASEYAATQLQNKSAEQVSKWVDSNRIWLEEVPDVLKSVERYAKKLDDATLNLEKITKTRKTAAPYAKGLGAGAAGAVGFDAYHRFF